MFYATSTFLIYEKIRIRFKTIVFQLLLVNSLDDRKKSWVFVIRDGNSFPYMSLFIKKDYPQLWSVKYSNQEETTKIIILMCFNCMKCIYILSPCERSKWAKQNASFCYLDNIIYKNNYNQIIKLQTAK